MKLTSQAFPYPVITDEPSDNSDFQESMFQCGLDFSLVPNKDPERPSKLIIRHNFMLSNPEINYLIEQNKASFALNVSCVDTLFRQIFFVENSAAEIELDASNFFGKVLFEPIIVIIENISDFTSEDLNEEYNGNLFSLHPGDIIGMSLGVEKYIDFNKLDFESLVKVKKSSDLDPLEYRISLDGEIILILMGTDLYDIWNDLRGSTSKRPLIAMSIYKDCILMALDYIKNNNDHESKQWARALTQKLDVLGETIHENLELQDLNRIAQVLIRPQSVGRLLRELNS